LSDVSSLSPLAAYEGREPPAPDWFTRAIARKPERDFIEVEGARVETLAWGDRGLPGLLFLHGGGAHADWYSFLAPFFADERRVVALSFTGMGGSDHRPAYALDQFAREAREAGRARGVFDLGRPVVAGHSFGGRIAIGLAHKFGEEFSAAVMVDPPLFSPTSARAPHPRKPAKPRRVQSSLPAILARFHLEPPQVCEHPYILDYIARFGAREAPGGEGTAGWQWRVDPFLWERMVWTEVAPLIPDAKCPLALIRGAKSKLFRAEDAAYIRALLPPDAPYVEIPEAEHHVLLDSPLSFVSSLRALFAAWPAARV
jgi:pimeloyl-ACP methyl ester carboxylesterase